MSLEVAAEQFDDLEQQHEAATLGMWVFLATEILFLGVLFAALTIIRYREPEIVAQASRHLNYLIGTTNTGVLLTSSLTMVIAVEAVKKGRNLWGAFYLGLTGMIGASFLGLKAYEYYDDYQKHIVPLLNYGYDGLDPAKAEKFFYLYYVMTAFHAIHLTIACGLVLFMAYRCLRRRFSREYSTPVEMAGLYWHFVDIVWVFLYPLLYLAGRAHG